jgi:ATP-dependent DNA ligase
MIIKEFRPMKAASMRADDEAWHSEKWIFEPKLDGVRQLCYIDDRGIRFKSPRISVQTNALVDNTARLPHLVKQLKGVPNGTVLDGEICSPASMGLSNSNYVMTLLKPLPEKAIERQKEHGWLEYHVFDILWLAGKDLRKKSLSFRRKKLRSLFKNQLASATTLFELPYVTATIEKNSEPTHEQKHKLLKDTLDRGGEGVVAKCLDSIYITRDIKSTKTEYRSPWWRKLKKYATYDTVIVGFTLPDKTSVKTDGTVSNNRFYDKKWISGVVVGQYIPRKEFDYKKTLHLLKGYRGAHKTYESVINYCTSHHVRINGATYQIQPYGVLVGMNDQIRRLMSEKPQDYIGKVIEIGANERFSETRAFRHPRFVRMREDKPPELCVYRAEET